MKLPFFHTKKTQGKLYGGIFLKESEGMILLIHPHGDIFEIKDVERFAYTDGWEHILEDVDEAIFRLEKRHGITVNEAIFFIYSHFVDPIRKEIKKPYVGRIQEIVKNLELQALGYIECHEAVVGFLEKKNESSLNAVLVEVDLSEIAVNVYKGGKSVFRNTGAKTQDLVQDIIHVLDPIKGTMLLPTRMVLYESKDVKEPTSRLFTHNWDKELFVQLPKIEVIKENDLLQALTEIFKEQVSSESEDTEKIKEKIEETSSQNEPKQKPTVQTIADTGFVMGIDVGAEENKKNNEKKSFFASLRAKIGLFFSKIRLPRGRMPVILFGILSLILLIALMGFNEYYFHTASLRVFLPYTKIEKNITLNGSPKGDDFTIQTSTISAEFTESKQTTGRKDIGETAKGSVTIYNLDDKETSLSSGTKLTAGDLIFTLDADVTIGAASIDSGTNETKPARTTATITAVEIGPESNIEKGKRFKIGDLSQTVFYAINDDSFKGGSKKQVQTVSKKDIDDLIKTIETKAKKSSDLQKTNTSDASFLPIEQLSQITLSQVDATKEVGEEASSVELTATVEKESYLYDDKAVKDNILNELNPQVKSGYAINEANITYTITKAVRTDEGVKLSIRAVAKQTPIINMKQIANTLVFKTKKDVEHILKNQYKVDGYELSIKDTIPFLNNVMPPFEKNIQIIISSE